MSRNANPFNEPDGNVTIRRTDSSPPGKSDSRSVESVEGSEAHRGLSCVAFSRLTATHRGACRASLGSQFCSCCDRPNLIVEACIYVVVALSSDGNMPKLVELLPIGKYELSLTRF